MQPFYSGKSKIVKLKSEEELIKFVTPEALTLKSKKNYQYNQEKLK
jgi:hypothetical protein